MDRITSSKPDVVARTIDLRLKGSDLYVARLGNCHMDPTPSPKPPPIKPVPAPPALPKPQPTSLHDELTQLSRTPSPSRGTPATAEMHTQKPEIRASRPCYRCVAAMHAVGIKRVFWTNADGEWECAKVREMVDSLDGFPGHDDGGVTGKGVFVTKHELLMLKRVMGF